MVCISCYFCMAFGLIKAKAGGEDFIFPEKVRSLANCLRMLISSYKGDGNVCSIQPRYSDTQLSPTRIECESSNKLSLCLVDNRNPLVLTMTMGGPKRLSAIKVKRIQHPGERETKLLFFLFSYYEMLLLIINLI